MTVANAHAVLNLHPKSYTPSPAESAHRQRRPRVTYTYRVDLFQHDRLPTLFALIVHQQHLVGTEVPREPVVPVGAASTLHHRVNLLGKLPRKFLVPIGLTR